MIDYNERRLMTVANITERAMLHCLSIHSSVALDIMSTTTKSTVLISSSPASSHK